MGRRSLNRYKHRPNLMAGFGPLLSGEGEGGGGGGQGTESGGQGGEAGKTGDEGKGAEKTLTQSEVNAIAAREKAEGKRAAERELAESLGVSIEDAKQIIQKHNADADAKKSEAEKAAEAATKEKQAAESEKDVAKREVHVTRLERAFLKEGVDLGEDDKSKRLLRMVNVEPGASYEDVLKDVQQIKKDFPELFGEKQQKQQRQAPGGDPKGTPRTPAGGEDAYARGAERAKHHRGAYHAAVDPTKK